MSLRGFDLVGLPFSGIFWGLPRTGRALQGQDTVILHELARFYEGFQGDDLTGKRDDVYTFEGIINYLNSLSAQGLFDGIP